MNEDRPAFVSTGPRKHDITVGKQNVLCSCVNCELCRLDTYCDRSKALLKIKRLLILASISPQPPKRWWKPTSAYLTVITPSVLGTSPRPSTSTGACPPARKTLETLVHGHFKLHDPNPRHRGRISQSQPPLPVEDGDLHCTVKHGHATHGERPKRHG
jgi:hypothetical protein